MEKVFISYSHNDKEWVRSWLLPKLEEAGLKVHIDFRDFEIGPPVLVNMERAIEQCEKTIVVLTPNWVASEYSNFEAVLLQTRDPLNIRKKIIPLMLIECELPRRLEILTWADFRNENEREFQIERVINQIKRDFAEIEKPVIEFPVLAEEKIDILRLPQTGHELFGRQKEQRILNEAWESKNTNVLSFVAYGGVGKSTLINKWLEKMRWDNYRGAEKVFGWSFYSQGTSERVTSADKFISEALEWFGDVDPTKGSPWDKGQRLADLVRKEKTLLILDGLEPLQSGYDYERGKIKDPALSILVTQLARNNKGLCVITTREKLDELKRFDKGVMQIDLEQISKEAGRALLRVGGVQGKDTELEAASEEFGNHALAINLLASYLHGIEGHHISNAKEIPDLDIPEGEGKHPRRVISAFEKRFGEGPKIQALRIMGLFDRPAHVDAVKAVRKGTKISGLTDKIKNLTEGKWHSLLDELRECKLLARKSEHNPDIIDCHPLMREHFGEKLQKDRPEAWREAHGRLYEYYKGVPEKELPDTLTEMEPLFAAVNHGCLAGRHKEALGDVFAKRMDRGEAYIGQQLGAMGAVIDGLAGLFDSKWKEPVEGLSEADKAYILNVSGFCLRSIGRLREAAGPMEAILDETLRKEEWRNTAISTGNLSEWYLAKEEWRKAAINAGNLSELYLILGNIGKAVDYARKCEEYAESSVDDIQTFRSYTTLADAQHQAGQLSRAKELFKEVEGMKKEQPPYYYRYLCGIEGFHFCDLLLNQGRYKEVEKRASQSLNLATEQKWPLVIGLDNLSLGQTYMLEAMNKGKSKKVKGKGKSKKAKGKISDSSTLRKGSLQTTLRMNLDKAEDFLNICTDGLRRSNEQIWIARSLLARAELNRYKQKFDKAWGDLEEAREIVERGEMNLYLADYHLEAARLCLAEGCKEKEAREHYEEAGKRVEEMGYHRRDPEVLLIKAELEIVEGNKEKAQKTLAKAKKRIDEMGCHRWDIEFERLKDSLS